MINEVDRFFTLVLPSEVWEEIENEYEPKTYGVTMTCLSIKLKRSV